jgi:Protein of unknown function (DUF3617)/Prokaryotic membrane lipoprotein lipid attachment site
MRKIIVAACALLALSACSNKNPRADNAVGGTISDAEAAKEIAREGAMPMQAGEWEERASFDTVDAPGYSPKALAAMKDEMRKGEVNKTCWTKDDAAKPSTTHFGGGGGPSGCAITVINRSGNQVKSAYLCKAGNSTTSGKMDGSYTADSYTIIIDQTISGSPEGAVRIQGKIESKRIGDCPTRFQQG